MASAVITNRTTEPNWTLPSVPPPPRGGGGPNTHYMGKLPFSNPNPNPKLSKKRHLSLQPLPILDIDESPGGGLTQSAASDDASSINRRPNDFNSSGYLTFNVCNYSKKELIELKSRFVTELDRIRKLKNQIESSDLRVRKSGPPPPSKKRPFPSTSKEPKRVGRIPKSNSNVVMNPGERAELMKKCGQILTKLMKHKHGYIFNTPVDVVGLKLHDYYDVIKCPMDLGTVKAKLGKNGYNSLGEFEADVRLTFDNAMRYNPKGHEVFTLAEVLLGKFEELYRPIKEKVGDGEAVLMVEEEEEEELEDRVREVEASSWDHMRGDMDLGRSDREDPVQIVGKPDPIGLNQNRDRVFESNPNTSVVNSGGAGVAGPQLPVRTPSPVRGPPVKPLKQPKPKAKDPNKREMSLAEKHKLGMGLQNLPPEKMEQVVTIIRKRNGHLRQDGDEIELDIEAVDTETLWELDRFVTNYKKMVSKMRRQVLMGANNVGVAAALPIEVNKDVPAMNERMEVVAEVKKPKKGDVGDEDVDIGDEMPMSSFPPVEIEKDNGHASSSSSSSSSSSDDSSSSSDSDSGSSSGSDSEDAHS